MGGGLGRELRYSPLGLGRKGGLLSLEEENCTKLVGSNTKFAVTKGQTPEGHRLTSKSAPTPSASIFIHSFAQRLAQHDQPGAGSLNLEPLLHH